MSARKGGEGGFEVVTYPDSNVHKDSTEYDITYRERVWLLENQNANQIAMFSDVDIPIYGHQLIALLDYKSFNHTPRYVIEMNQKSLQWKSWYLILNVNLVHLNVFD